MAALIVLLILRAVPLGHVMGALVPLVLVGFRAVPLGHAIYTVLAQYVILGIIVATFPRFF